MNESVHPTMRAFLNVALAVAPRSRIVSLPGGYFEFRREDQTIGFRVENGEPRVVSVVTTDGSGRKTWSSPEEISDYWHSVYVDSIKRELSHD